MAILKQFQVFHIILFFGAVYRFFPSDKGPFIDRRLHPNSIVTLYHEYELYFVNSCGAFEYFFC